MSKKQKPKETGLIALSQDEDNENPAQQLAESHAILDKVFAPDDSGTGFMILCDHSTEKGHDVGAMKVGIHNLTAADVIGHTLDVLVSRFGAFPVMMMLRQVMASQKGQGGD